MAGADAVSRDDSVTQWTKVAAVASLALLVAGRLFDWVPPAWLINVANPPAWLANILGLTALRPYFLLGIAEAPARVAGYAGSAGMGGYLLVLLYSVGSGKLSPTVHPILSLPLKALNLLLLVSMQFIFQHGLIAQADAARAKGNSDLEFRALLAAHHISESTGMGTVLGDFAATFRLVSLEASSPRADLPRTGVFSIRIGTINLEVDSRLPVIPTGLKASKGAHLRNFERALRTSGVDADVKALGDLMLFDPALQISVNAAIALMIVPEFMKSVDAEAASELSRNSSKIRLVIEASDEKLADSHFVSMPGADGSIAAFYSSESNEVTLRLAPRLYELQMREYLSELTYLESLDLEHTSNVSMRKTARSWLARVAVPLAHEFWHALAAQTKGLSHTQAAIDEGLASCVQISFERMMDAQAEQVMEAAKWQNGLPSPVILARMVKASARSPTEDVFSKRIRDAAHNGTLIKPASLLSLSAGAIQRADDPTLLYAEGWALVPNYLYAPDRARLLDAIARNRPGRDDDAEFWSELEKRMIESHDWMAHAR
jgi:hypothetical protein